MFDWIWGNFGFFLIFNWSKNVDYFGSYCCCCDGGGCGWWWFGGCSGGRSCGGRCGSIIIIGLIVSRVYFIVFGVFFFVIIFFLIIIFIIFCGKVLNKFLNLMKKNLYNIWSMRVYYMIYFEYYIIGVWLLWNYSDIKRLFVIFVNKCW